MLEGAEPAQATAGSVAGGRPSYYSNCGRVASSVSSRIGTKRIYTGPHRVEPNRPGWARSVSALKLLNILRDVTTNMAAQTRIFNS